MPASIRNAVRSFIVFPVAVLLVVLAQTYVARAQTVNNPSFEVPSIANEGPPKACGHPTSASSCGFIVNPVCPTAHTPNNLCQIWWSFGLRAVNGVITAASGVQQNGSSYGAPKAPDGTQTAFIHNLGGISQTIGFPASGYYALSFQLAARKASVPANSTDKLQISIDGNPIQTVTPQSTSAFDKVTVPFWILNSEGANGSNHTLLFTGLGVSGTGTLGPKEDTMVFIDEVSIGPARPPIEGPGGPHGPNPLAAPEITSGPSDLWPWSSIILEGTGFGSQPGTFHLHFPSASAVNFANSSSDNNLILNPVANGWLGTATTGMASSQKISDASPVGDVPEQTVEITVTSVAGFLPSKPWSAKFHNAAYITSGPQTVTPGQKFNLKGWDFGNQPGTVTIHFPTASYQNFSNGSNTDLVLNNISSQDWLPDGVKVTVPSSVAGVVQQTVKISFIAADGRKSNTWDATFNPTIVTIPLPSQNVAVNSCSNQGDTNVCNTQAQFGNCAFGPTDTTGLNVGSIDGEHVGCWCCDSDNGTDVYSATVSAPWSIQAVNVYPTVTNNASANILPTLILPGQTSIGVTVTWHVGSDGGYVDYSGDIMIQGPQGVPYN